MSSVYVKIILNKYTKGGEGKNSNIIVNVELFTLQMYFTNLGLCLGIVYAFIPLPCKVVTLKEGIHASQWMRDLSFLVYIILYCQLFSIITRVSNFSPLFSFHKFSLFLSLLNYLHIVNFFFIITRGSNFSPLFSLPQNFLSYSPILNYLPILFCYLSPPPPHPNTHTPRPHTHTTQPSKRTC